MRRISRVAAAVVGVMFALAWVAGEERSTRRHGKESKGAGEADLLLQVAGGYETPGATEEETRKNLGEAVNIYRQAIESGATGDARADAWWGIGRCEAKRGNLWTAFEAIEKSFPKVYDAKRVDPRVELEYEIAERLWALGDAEIPDSGPDKKKRKGRAAASRVYEAVVYNEPNSPHAPAALLKRADTLAADGESAPAAEAYRRLIREYAATPEGAEARPALAEVLLRGTDEKPPTPQETKDAESLLVDAEAATPIPPAVAARVARARKVGDERIAVDLLEKGRFYLKRGTTRSRDSAVFVLRDVMRRYPDTQAAAKARTMLSDLGATPEEEKR